ncbi:MAG: alpha/beta hydrolase [Pirellulaceae bacterium]
MRNFRNCAPVFVFFCICVGNSPLPRQTVLNVWPDMALAETTASTGNKLPPRDTDRPTITRVEGITQPTIQVFPAAEPCGTAVLILPGGGFRYVVPDLEGSEAAAYLNDLGITAFVLNYRTTNGPDPRPWYRPLQDSQRAIRLIRGEAKRWKIDPEQVGLFGFSAGGQVAAIHLTDAEVHYSNIDDVDGLSAKPDFGVLIYPWNIYDADNDRLIDPVRIDQHTPKTFLVHTHDDRSSSLGAVLFYTGLKRLSIASELHVYQNGGHGYGTRAREGSVIGTWKERMADWLQINGLSHQK